MNKSPRLVIIARRDDGVSFLGGFFSFRLFLPSLVGRLVEIEWVGNVRRVPCVCIW